MKKHIRKLEINDSLTTNPSQFYSLGGETLLHEQLYQPGAKDADGDILIDNFLSNLEIPNY